MITTKERLALVDGILRQITAPTDLEMEALRELTVARIANREARRILKILRAGGVVP